MTCVLPASTQDSGHASITSATAPGSASFPSHTRPESSASNPLSISGDRKRHTSGAAFAAAAATRGPTQVARNATLAMTGLGAPWKGTRACVPPSPSSNSSPSTPSCARKPSSTGKRTNRMTHCSADFVPTRAATARQSSPCRSAASNKASVSWSVQLSSSSVSLSSSFSSCCALASPVAASSRESPQSVDTTRVKLAELTPSGSDPLAKHETHVTHTSRGCVFPPASSTR
mmetsp:Transcript_15638/g.51332  ORF Transcript_15638/g.51332 Transcript_15638/m.51332 type:complete len:231 (+) Transcript_15638:838-1530(+)